MGSRTAMCTVSLYQISPASELTISFVALARRKQEGLDPLGHRGIGPDIHLSQNRYFRTYMGLGGPREGERCDG